MKIKHVEKKMVTEKTQHAADRTYVTITDVYPTDAILKPAMPLINSFLLFTNMHTLSFLPIRATGWQERPPQ